MTEPNQDPNDLDISNVIGLLMTIKKIREQEPLDDPKVIMIDEDGKRYY